jgi:hypothetical protein
MRAVRSRRNARSIDQPLCEHTRRAGYERIEGGMMLAAVGGVGIVGIVVIVLVVLAVLYFVRRA